MEQNKESRLNVRCDPAFRSEIEAAANRHFGGNESLLMREAARLYLALRGKFGVQYEPVVARLLGHPGETAQERAA